jgi:hypothetical protein
MSQAPAFIKSAKPTLVTAKVGNKIFVACQINGKWHERSGANFGLAKRYLETDLAKLGFSVPSEWEIDDQGDQGSPEAPKAPPVSPLDETGLISPRAKEWLPMFKMAFKLIEAKSGTEDMNQFRKDVDAVLRTIGARPAFERLPNGQPTLSLAGIKDPTIRAPKAGEGERRIIPGLNGFGRDSKGRAYFEEGSRVRATPIETFNDFRAIEANGGEVPKRLSREERRAENKRKHAEKRDKAKPSTSYTKQVWDAGKALSWYAAEKNQDRVFWYKVGVVAMIRNTKQDLRVDFERVVIEGLTNMGLDADSYLANDALKLIAAAIEAKAASM